MYLHIYYTIILILVESRRFQGGRHVHRLFNFLLELYV